MEENKNDLVIPNWIIILGIIVATIIIAGVPSLFINPPKYTPLLCTAEEALQNPNCTNIEIAPSRPLNINSTKNVLIGTYSPPELSIAGRDDTQILTIATDGDLYTGKDVTHWNITLNQDQCKKIPCQEGICYTCQNPEIKPTEESFKHGKK